MKKTVIITIAVFLLSTLIISALYISTFGESETIGAATIKMWCSASVWYLVYL